MYRFIIWIKGVKRPLYVSKKYDDKFDCDDVAFKTLMSYVSCDDFKDYSYEIVEVLFK